MASKVQASGGVTFGEARRSFPCASSVTILSHRVGDPHGSLGIGIAHQPRIMPPRRARLHGG